ncbi:Desulfoferrodoxin [bioreactor metagenome]|uniref:Desulfoferrodoxin n=1 Tax=bioreactor metagenome TaxID=1076179 RepID=A0A645A0N9_9ZZZZ
MLKGLSIYRCSDCCNSLEVIEKGEPQLVCNGSSYALRCSKADAQVSCCGKPMELLIPNTVDASSEKHVPVAEFGNDGGELVVKVGSVAHPMTAEHYIEWIAVVSDNRVQRVNLKSGQSPEATFCACEATELDLYAYCNLHGLWKATIKK